MGADAQQGGRSHGRHRVPPVLPVQHGGRRPRSGFMMAAGAGRRAAPRRRHPAVVVCAWCEVNGQVSGAARDPASAEWRTVSHAFVRDAKLAGRASHGLCPHCRPLVLADWGLG
jgi:hypothetical protein